MVLPYRFDLVNAYSLAKIGTLHSARDRILDVTLNRPGNARFWMPTFAEYAKDVKKIKTALLVYVGNSCVWGGPIWGIQRDLEQRRMSITAVGWFQRLMRRMIYLNQVGDQPYSSMDAGTMAINLLAKANARGVVPAGAPSATMITAGSVQASINRTRRFEVGQYIGQEIIKLSDIENGFDFYVDPISRQLHIYYPRYGQDRPDVLLAYNWGPRNVQNVLPQEDAETKVNGMLARGKYGNAWAEDADDIAEFGLLEDAVQLADVTDDNILLAYAGGEVLTRTNPLTYNVILKPETEDAVPQFFVKYGLGDTVYLTARGDLDAINRQPMRVFGATINIDNQGNSRVSSLKTQANE